MTHDAGLILEPETEYEQAVLDSLFLANEIVAHITRKPSPDGGAVHYVTIKPRAKDKP